MSYIVTAAAIGLYLLKSKHANIKEFGSEFRPVVEKMVGNKKQDTEKTTTKLMLKFAPQFDGLHPLETLIDY
ncbi:hypothetical protein Leryth_000216 [Lithospermum erythrorhizon]|nr:hypothetical protein Leryth_000216 [Lithospermum erythrorhizon]